MSEKVGHEGHGFTQLPNFVTLSATEFNLEEPAEVTP